MRVIDTLLVGIGNRDNALDIRIEVQFAVL